jgi:hypothetical protein
MSLAFALMAAINGSTGSSATLSYGLKGTKPRRRQPGGGKILTAPRWRRKPSETLACESPSWRPRLGRSRFVGCARRRQAGSAGVGAQAVAAAPSSVACSVTV